ncbi:MAG: hypothetical protein ACTSO7_07415 [Candidatus Heimdallarchaeota archaeon]
MNRSNPTPSLEFATDGSATDISSDLGTFMGTFDDVKGIGVYNLAGYSLFSSAKDDDGDHGLTAFKSLLGLVGSQINLILPPESNVQFIAPNDILVGVSKIGSNKILAVVLNRDAQLAHLIPNIIKVAKLLKGVAQKTGTLSNSICQDACKKTITDKARSSRRKNIVRKLGA